MKRIIFIGLLFASLSTLAQEDKTELEERFNVIRNETASGANTRVRIADAYQKLADATQGIHYATASGTDTYTASVLNVVSYTGKWFVIRFTNANTGAATLNINSIGAVAIQLDGAALSAGDISSGSVHILAYDGSYFQLASKTKVSATSPITFNNGVISTSISQGRLLGRTTFGTGVAEQITVSNGLTLSGGALKLGGTLNGSSTVNGAGYPFIFSGLGGFGVTGTGGLGLSNETSGNFSLSNSGSGYFSLTANDLRLTAGGSSGSSGQLLTSDGTSATWQAPNSILKTGTTSLTGNTTIDASYIFSFKNHSTYGVTINPDRTYGSASQSNLAFGGTNIFSGAGPQYGYISHNIGSLTSGANNAFFSFENITGTVNRGGYTGSKIYGLYYNPAISGTGSLTSYVFAGGGESVGVIGGTTTTNASAILDLQSTTKAFLPPRMTTTQKNAISPVSEGMVVFDTTIDALCVYTGAVWHSLTPNVNTVVLVGTTLELSNAHNGALIYTTGSSPITITIPSGLTTKFNCIIVQASTGAITIDASAITVLGSPTLTTAAAGDTKSVVLYAATDNYLIK